MYNINIIGIVLAIIVVATFTLWVWYTRKRDRRFQELLEAQSAPLDPETQYTRISIVIVCYEQADSLKHSLPHFLKQDYDCFEVVVVDATTTDTVSRLIESYREEFPHLRRTFVPSEGTRIQNMERFALMLGLRAARSEWVAVVSSDAKPASAEWLKRMARHIATGVDVVIGTGVGKDLKNFCMRKQIYETNNYTLEDFEKRFSCQYEWSPQACIYQQE